MKQVKMNWPDRALIASIMVPCEEESWKAILPLVEETGADGIELNFGCPHGMSSAAWVPPSARCRNISKWSFAGASSTHACR
jgi:dihydroorotate dehydrogenase